MNALERQWQRRGIGSLLLLPLAAVFGLVGAARRACYRHGLLRSARLPVPVIVVGNIAVGGTGKTPLVLWLCDALIRLGHRPGIITRGYRGSATQPSAVPPDGDAAYYGDEAVLLAQHSGCPVWVGRRRAAAGRALLAAHPACDILVSDDGLQHYALARDFEIAVVDGTREHGNGRLLPAGPLREPVSRLATVDAVVVNGAAPANDAERPHYRMDLVGDQLVRLREPAHRMPVSALRGRPVHAVAGIGNPARFFAHLERLGLDVMPHPFPDHHPYAAQDFAFVDGAPVVMTEKDAVKCIPHAGDDWWVLPVAARVDAGLVPQLLRTLENR